MNTSLARAFSCTASRETCTASRTLGCSTCGMMVWRWRCWVVCNHCQDPSFLLTSNILQLRSRCLQVSGYQSHLTQVSLQDKIPPSLISIESSKKTTYCPYTLTYNVLCMFRIVLQRSLWSRVPVSRAELETRGHGQQSRHVPAQHVARVRRPWSPRVSQQLSCAGKHESVIQHVSWSIINIKISQHYFHHKYCFLMNEIDLLLLYHCCLHYRAREPSHKSVLCLDHCLDNILLIRRCFYK